MKSFLLVLLIVTAGCSSPSSTLDAATAAEMQATAVVERCGIKCESLDVYVLTQMRTLEGIDGIMPDETREAISSALANVTFVDLQDSNGLFTEDFLVDEGRGVLVQVGAPEDLSSRVVGVEVGVITARDGGKGFVQQFIEDTDGWRLTDSEETGIISEEWVS